MANMPNVPDRFEPKEYYDKLRREVHGERWNWTTDDALQGTDVKGLTVVVTGSNSGLGKETTRALAAAGARVFATVRSAEKGAELVKELAEQGLTVEALELEMDSFASVDRFLSELESRRLRVDAFINNAAKGVGPFVRTGDGFEAQMQVNYLSVAVLVHGLLTRNLMAQKGRIVVVASAGHCFAPPDTSAAMANWDDEASYHPHLQYFISKWLGVVYANHISNQLKAAGSEVTITSVHPGVIMTNLVRDVDPAEIAASGLVDKQGNFIPAIRTVSEGASTQVWAAVSPELDGVTGEYLENCKVTPRDTVPDLDPTFWKTTGTHPKVFDKDTQTGVIEATEARLQRKVAL